MGRSCLAAVVCLLFLAPLAGAATLEQVGEGGLLNGAPPAEVPTGLELGDRITGPARIRSAAGDVLTLPAGTVVVFFEPANLPEPEEGAPPMEHFLLERGALLGEISYSTTIALPFDGYFTGRKDASASVYVETLDGEQGFFRVNEGQALVSYRDVLNAILERGQGLELSRFGEGPKDFRFRTHQSNVGDVMAFVRPGRIEIRLGLPKATSGTISQQPGGLTKVESDASSWQGGGITVQTGGGEEAKAGRIGPGAFALINNETGEIQFGFIEVDFEIVERAISLTSEFSVLAVSNFFGLK